MSRQSWLSTHYLESPWKRYDAPISAISGPNINLRQWTGGFGDREWDTDRWGRCGNQLIEEGKTKMASVPMGGAVAAGGAAAGGAAADDGGAPAKEEAKEEEEESDEVKSARRLGRRLNGDADGTSQLQDMGFGLFD